MPVLIFLLFPLLLLSGCTGALIGGGAAAVGAASVKEGGLSGTVKDARIQTTINDLWFRHNVDMFRKLDLTVNQGRVLITGVVQTPEHRVDAVRLAWKAKGVQQVINEIKISGGAGVGGFLSDSWIGTQIRTSLVLDKKIENLNYTIDVVDGTVYLMGVAQNKSELETALKSARTTRGVNRVVNYVRMAGEERFSRTAGAPAASTPVSDDPDPMLQPEQEENSPPKNPGAVRAEPLPLY